MARDFSKDGVIIDKLDSVDLSARLTGASAVTVSGWFVYDTLDSGWAGNNLIAFFNGATLQFRISIGSTQGAIHRESESSERQHSDKGIFIIRSSVC